MGHSMLTTKFTDKLTIMGGNIYRTLTAQYKDHKPLVVMKQSVKSEEKLMRNLDCGMVSGWVYADPDDKSFKWYNNNKEDRYGIDDWWVCQCSCSLTGKATQTYDELEALILKSKQKGFIYSLKAYREANEGKDINISQIFDLLQMWTCYPKNEFLIKLGYYTLALSKTILKMNKNKQKTIIQYLVNDMGDYRGDKATLNLTELKCLMNKVDNYYLFCQCNRNLTLYKYLLKQKEQPYIYFDYKDMCKELGKDLTDDYWLYPSNLAERHNLVSEQVEAKREAERLIRLEREKAEKLARAKKEKEIVNSIVEIGNNLGQTLNTTINGYEISVASSLKDIKEQADTLSQCLITCNYYKKYAEKKCILVFIKRGEERLATAEVFYNKKKPLGQFYGDERDRDNCLPNEEIKGAFDTWLNNVYLTSNLVRA